MVSFLVKGTTLKQKTLAFCLFLFVPLIFLPIFFEIIVFENILKPLLWFILLVSIALSAIVIRHLFTKGSAIQQYFKSSKERPWVMAIFIPLVIPFVLIMIFAKALPIFLHILHSSPATMIVTVKQKDAIYSKRYCSGGFEVEEFRLFLNNRVCDIDIESWKRLKEGGKVILLGSQSSIGFIYDSVTIFDDSCDIANDY